MSAIYRQQVPRPAEIRQGEPPPWSRRPPAERASVPVDRLRRALVGLPSLSPTGAIDAAVLAPIVERDGEACLVFIRRSGELARDAGHIAFPGGHLEAGEAPLAAALRESREEIGLDPGLVEIVGSFGVLERRERGEKVVPFVGLVTGQPSFVGDGHEVAAILDVPLASLAADAVCWQERWGPVGADAGVCFFAGRGELAEDLIWGLTARIVWELLAAVFAGT